MKVQVLYFAVLRERIGRESEWLELGSDATVGNALELLGDRHDAVNKLHNQLRCAVNQEFVALEAPLDDGDELALIPPVAGGAGNHARILDEPLSLERVVAAVAGPEHGGIATFTGQVRRHSRGVQVQRLEYQAYVEMAAKVLRELCQSIEREIPGVRLAVEHRIGVLAVGETAVVIAAAAPHRAEAFDACRTLIDRLKDSAPIWKKEIDSEGEVWVGLGP